MGCKISSLSSLDKTSHLVGIVGDFGRTRPSPSPDPDAVSNDQSTSNIGFPDQIYDLACNWDIADDRYHTLTQRLRRLDWYRDTQPELYHFCRLRQVHMRVKEEHLRLEDRLVNLEHDILAVQTIKSRNKSVQAQRNHWSGLQGESAYRIPETPVREISKLPLADDTQTSRSAPNSLAYSCPGASALNGLVSDGGVKYAGYDSEADWLSMSLKLRGRNPKYEPGSLQDLERVVMMQEDFEQPGIIRNPHLPARPWGHAIANMPDSKEVEADTVKLKKLSLLCNMSTSLREKLSQKLSQELEKVLTVSTADSNPEACRLYQSRKPGTDGRPRTMRGKMAVTWKDPETFGTHETQRYGMQFGIADMIVHNRMTPEQKWGFVHGGWDLSHLCGNSSCIYPPHLTMEPHEINIERIGCHRVRTGAYFLCTHSPRCLLRDEAGKVKVLKLLEDEDRKLCRSQDRGCPHGIAGAATYRPAPAAKALKEAEIETKRKRKAGDATSAGEIEAPTPKRGRPWKQAQAAYEVPESPPSTLLSSQETQSSFTETPPSSQESTVFWGFPIDLPGSVVSTKDFHGKTRRAFVNPAHNFQKLLSPSKHWRQPHTSPKRPHSARCDGRVSRVTDDGSARRNDRSTESEWAEYFS
ncbi:Endonuclease His-metal-binding finger [Macrophomina phaseolina MS6]|uniref:Endonuclease His-metal-binding finger n=1 Tax=Macrophomina phaseolina (strain MS6) TaxID=1126212 RepID=K2S4R4_MACPH|nr:Endonuclease His-metal-binding finger [Macrophomina phaseolina MS6]